MTLYKGFLATQKSKGRLNKIIRTGNWIFCILMLFIMVLNIPYAYSGLQSNDVLLPTQLGEIKERSKGKQENPLVFIIGESHVALEVQKSVADILSYLIRAYDVTLVCTEGYSKSIGSPISTGSHLAHRVTAAADLKARRINAVEYIARAYSHVRVFGVEDMRAYGAHDKAIGKIQQDTQKLSKQIEQWSFDFEDFLSNDLGNLKVTRIEAEKLENAFEQFTKDKNIEALADAMYDLVGRKSNLGQKLTALMERKKSIEKASAPKIQDTPEMKDRDIAMVSNTLSLAHKSNAVALVVGMLHLPGIETTFKIKGISYVTILPIGVEESTTSSEWTEEEQQVYEGWKKRIKTPFEEWLSHFKPLPAASRPSFVKRNEIIGSLLNADLMLRQGSSTKEVLKMTHMATLPEGFRISQLFKFENGNAIEFTFEGKKAYIYFSTRRIQKEVDKNYKKLEEGVAGNLHYTLYDDGGTGGRPPIPPRDGISGGTGDESNYLVAIKKQKKKNPDAITIRFVEENGILFRYVSEKKRPLYVSITDVQSWIDAFEKYDPGPEKLFAAQKLDEMLLADFDVDLPRYKPNVLYQISQQDFLSDFSLPNIAQLSGDKNAKVMEEIKEVYTIPWQKEQKDLANILSQRPPRVNIRKTVILISDTFKKFKNYSQAIKAIKKSGAVVNSLPRDSDTVIVFGSSTDETWRLTLNDGTKLTLKSQVLSRILKDADNVALFNVDLDKSLKDSIKCLKDNRLTIDDNANLELAQRIVKEINSNSGKKSMDHAIRDAVESAGSKIPLKKMFSLESQKKKLSASVFDRVWQDLNSKTTIYRAG